MGLKFSKNCIGCPARGVSAELMGILGVGAALAGLILTASLWIGGWLPDVDRSLAHLEGLIEGAGLFRPSEAAELAGD